MDLTAQLEQRLQENPGDPQGWLLLGRTYKTMQLYDRAESALVSAYELAPDVRERSDTTVSDRSGFWVRYSDFSSILSPGACTNLCSQLRWCRSARRMGSNPAQRILVRPHP